MKCINVKSVVAMAFMAAVMLICAPSFAQEKMQHKTPEERTTSLKAVLTPDQFTKFESMKENMKGKMKDKQKEKS